MECAEGRLKASASLQNPSEDVNRVCRLAMVKPTASPKTAGISSSVKGFFCRYWPAGDSNVSATRRELRASSKATINRKAGDALMNEAAENMTVWLQFFLYMKSVFKFPILKRYPPFI